MSRLVGIVLSISCGWGTENGEVCTGLYKVGQPVLAQKLFHQNLRVVGSYKAVMDFLGRGRVSLLVRGGDGLFKELAPQMTHQYQPQIAHHPLSHHSSVAASIA